MSQAASPQSQISPAPITSFARACSCGERLEGREQPSMVVTRLIADWDSRHRGERDKAARLCGLAGNVELVLPTEPAEATDGVGCSVVDMGLVAGVFPTHEPVMPDGFPPRPVVYRDELRRIVIAVRVLSGDIAHVGDLGLEPDGDGGGDRLSPGALTRGLRCQILNASEERWAIAR